MKRYLTEDCLEKFKKELEHLEKVRRREVSERIRHTASQGDLKENAGYDAAKEEQGFLEARIRELKEIIAQTEIINKKSGGKIQIGSVVCLSSKEGKEKFQIVGPEEAEISFKSPLGEALLNKGKGAVVEISVPDGKKEYKIVKIE